MRSGSEIVKGVARIAAEYGVSERTARRMFQQGKLPGAYKSGTGGRTSMLAIERKALEAIKKGG